VSCSLTSSYLHRTCQLLQVLILYYLNNLDTCILIIKIKQEEETLLFKQFHDLQLIQIEQECCEHEPIELVILDMADGDSSHVIDELISLALSTIIMETTHQHALDNVENRDYYGSSERGEQLATNQVKDMSQMDYTRRNTGILSYT
jgi:hypothetical protein